VCGHTVFGSKVALDETEKLKYNKFDNDGTCRFYIRIQSVPRSKHTTPRLSKSIG
jgi:hypothetical protein